MLIDVAISGVTIMIKKEDEKILKYKDLTINIQHVCVESKNKSDTCKNKGNWNYLKIIQKKSEQHTRKAQNQRPTKNIHTGHCIHTWNVLL